MTHSNTHSPQDDPTQQATAHRTRWIQVQRRYQLPATSNPRAAQLPPTQGASAPAIAQQPIDPRDIFGFVQQHGRNEPWDGIAMVQATQRTTTANWYNPQQYEYQYQFYDHQYRPHSHGDVAYQQDQGDNNNTHHHAQEAHSASSTHAQHGSQERQQGLTSFRRDEHHHRQRRSQRRA